MVKKGNKSVSHTAGSDNICIQTSMRCTLTLKDVRHILDLISIHMLDKMDTTTLSTVEIGSSPRDHWWWHETDYVVHCKDTSEGV